MTGASESPNTDSAPLTGEPTTKKSVEGKKKGRKTPAVVGDVAAAESGRTRKFRGKMHPVVRVTQDTRTGAIYDHVQYTRTVIDRLSKEKTVATLIRKIRRPGTGIVGAQHEIELKE